MSKERAQDELTDRPRPARVRRLTLLAITSAAVLGLILTLVLLSRSPTPLSKAVLGTSEHALKGAQGGDYSRFQHTNPQHARLPCLLCHRREDNSPLPVRSVGHTPCSGCHTQQFADASSPICTICHENPSPSAVKPFPALSSFKVTFDHARHASGAARPTANCAACHSPERRGVAFSIPAGTDAHTTCFQCHSPGAQSEGRDIASCETCHELGRHARTPEWSSAFGFNFSHTEHTRRGLSCASCHSVKAGAAQGRQVTSPVPLHHHAPARAQSCMTCHNNKRAFGGDDFSDCTKCHRGNAWRF
jgi:c(7)-type cytochrome triheme protein